MTPVANGKLLTLDLVLNLLGIDVKVTGTIEALDVRKRLT